MGTSTVARKTRPRNRRQLVVAAAAQLFYRRGFDHVSMGNIAEAVGIGPSALYRHFSGKQDLLSAVIDAGFAPVVAQLGDLNLHTKSAALTQLSELALDERYIGVLWRREARYLTVQSRAQLRDELFQITNTLTSKIRETRPELDTSAADLIAWSLLAVLTSPSLHRLHLPRPEFVQLLSDLGTTVLNTQFPAGFSAAERDTFPSQILPFSRREALLAKAIQMFATHGYPEVGIEDIGKAIGITGPSIYNHFGSKLEMLIAAFDRAGAALLLGLAPIFTNAVDTKDALNCLVIDYISFCRTHHYLISLLITEVDHLSEHDRERSRRMQHDYVSEWVHLLRSVSPNVDPVAARIRVHAAMAVVNDAAQMPHLRNSPDLSRVLESLCWNLLVVP